MAREDIYKMAHELSRDLTRAHRRAQRDCPSKPPPTSSPQWHEIDFVALFEKQCMAH
jgi:hypothetical protein